MEEQPMKTRSRAVNPEGSAALIGFGLFLMAVDRFAPAGDIYFWFAFFMAIVGTVALTPWGSRLR